MCQIVGPSLDLNLWSVRPEKCRFEKKWSSTADIAESIQSNIGRECQTSETKMTTSVRNITDSREVAVPDHLALTSSVRSARLFLAVSSHMLNAFLPLCLSLSCCNF